MFPLSIEEVDVVPDEIVDRLRVSLAIGSDVPVPVQGVVLQSIRQQSRTPEADSAGAVNEYGLYSDIFLC
jgi:hypothetical protein